MQAEVGDAVVQGVDGEVATQRVFLDIAPDVVAQQQAVIGLGGDVLAVVVTGLATEGGDLDDLAAETHVHDTEAAADDARIAKQLLDLLRRGVGGHVEILGSDPEQGITQAASDQIGFVAGVVQAIEHLEGGFAELTTRHGVFVASEYAGHRRSCGGFLSAEQRLQVLAWAL